jgi:SAM-dependent methyltransferase
MDDLGWFLKRFSKMGVRSILDVGCGIGQYAERFETYHAYLGIDIVPDYLCRAAKNSHLPYLVMDVTKWGDEGHATFVANSFDAVLWFDSIEHLEKEDGIEALKDSILIARKCVGVFTPHGFLEQTENVWGGEAKDAQVHKSGWTGDDLVPLNFTEIETRKTHRKIHGEVEVMYAMWRDDQHHTAN